jgi:hypothetical protein
MSSTTTGMSLPQSYIWKQATKNEENPILVKLETIYACADHNNDIFGN